MRFRSKIVLAYTSIALLFSIIMGMMYYGYSIREFKSAGYNNSGFLADQIIRSFDESMGTMKQISDYILSDKTMLSSIRTLASKAKGNKQDMSSEKNALQNGLTTNYIVSNFYRVLVYNQLGDVAYSGGKENQLVDTEIKMQDIPWISAVHGTKGREILIGPHKDDWGLKKQEIVYSMVKEIQGDNMGYIEVQRQPEYLNDIFSVNGKVNIMLLLNDGSVLYYQGDSQSKDFYQSLEIEEKKNTFETSQEVNGRMELISTRMSSDYGVKLVLAMDMSEVAEGAARAALAAVAIAVCFFAASMVSIIFISGRLTKPINDLKEQMENTRLENMSEVPLLDTENDEMVALGKTYRQLMNRLNESIVKEKRLSLLRLQAQFDTLQAQINPHFLYNVLNVISNRGIVNGDEEICEICGSLAAMLRYSTNNRKRYATVREELEYLEKYIFLLKSRYDYRLEVEVSSAEELNEEIMPKIVLQQLVENSIQHGFNNSTFVMRISVRGWKDEEGWFFQVHDNGEGITDEVKKRLEDKIEKIENKILRKSSNIEMEIGGMGLANTYARMFLLYADRTVFRMENLNDGFSVTIGVKKER